MKTRTKIIGGLILIGAIFLSIYAMIPETGGPQAPVPVEEEYKLEYPGEKAGAKAPVEERGMFDIMDPTLRGFDIIDRILEGLEFGNIAFNAPQSMNLYDTSKIQLILGLETSIDELKEMIEAEGEKEGARIRISNRMEARLSGRGFAITAITPEIQAVSRIEVTEWQWEVKPTSEGSHILHLTLSALLNVDGADTAKAIRTFDRVIEVEVSWRQRVSSFLKENWQWLWAVLLVPIGGWLWKKIKRKKPNAI